MSTIFCKTIKYRNRERTNEYSKIGVNWEESSEDQIVVSKSIEQHIKEMIKKEIESNMQSHREIPIYVIYLSIKMVNNVSKRNIARRRRRSPQ